MACVWFQTADSRQRVSTVFGEQVLRDAHVAQGAGLSHLILDGDGLLADAHELAHVHLLLKVAVLNARRGCGILAVAQAHAALAGRLDQLREDHPTSVLHVEHGPHVVVFHKAFHAVVVGVELGS